MELTYTTRISSRDFHVYGKTVWRNPKRGEKIEVRKESSEIALLIDPHAIAWTRKSKARLVPDVVGHVPLELSRFIHFFLDRGGKLAATVFDENFRPSPIPKGGLEILLQVTFKIQEDKRRYLDRLKDLIEMNYEIPKIEAEVYETDIEKFQEEEADDEIDATDIILLDK